MIFYVATALFVSNFVLGALVQLRVVDTKPFRWLHHALFFLVFVSAALAVVWGLWSGKPYGFTTIPTLPIYYFLTRVRAGTPGHAALASAAMVFYAIGVVSMV